MSPAGSIAIGALTSVLVGPALASAQIPDSIAFAAVVKYLSDEEYPELFGNQPYRVRVRGYEVADIDGDGLPEVFLWTDPHYRQSATITIFTLTQDRVVRRIFEGLAPGPLVPVTGRYLDSHTLGMAVDASVFDSTGKLVGSDSGMIRAAVGTGVNLVRYATFYHMDMRRGHGGYIDLSYQTAYAEEKTCEKFEFAPVEDFVVGALASDRQGHYLVASAGGRLTFYRIEGIGPGGLVRKHLLLSAKPGDFATFVHDTGAIRYRTFSGAMVPLRAGPP